MNKKGFTLMELLAVVVVLAIIALIAVPIILNVIEKSKQSSAVDSAYGYLNAIEKYTVLNQVDNVKYPYNIKNGTWDVIDETNGVLGLNNLIMLKGEKPISGEVTINKKGLVTRAEIVINGYNVICENGTCRSNGKAEALSTYGLFDESGKMVVNYNKLVSQYHFDVEKDYSSTASADNYYKKNGSGSMYDIITNNSSLSGVKKIVLPDTVTKIGVYAFADSSIETIVIPDSVTSIGGAAFYHSRNLKNVTLPNGIKEISANVFNGCSSLANLSIPESVKEIKSRAFYESGLEILNLPNNVTSIDDYAFYKNQSLSEVNIGSSLKYVGTDSLNFNTNLETITVDEGNQKYYTQGNNLIEKSTKRIVLGTKNSVIPDDVLIIGRRSFIGSGVENITIPASVTMIEEGAFSGSSLVTMTFEDPDNWKKCFKGSSSSTCDSNSPDLTNPSQNPSYYSLNGDTLFFQKK